MKESITIVRPKQAHNPHQLLPSDNFPDTLNNMSSPPNRSGRFDASFITTIHDACDGKATGKITFWFSAENSNGDPARPEVIRSLLGAGKIIGSFTIDDEGIIHISHVRAFNRDDGTVVTTAEYDPEKPTKCPPKR